MRIYIYRVYVRCFINSTVLFTNHDMHICLGNNKIRYGNVLLCAV
jgi:hypothetical protein